MSLDKSTSRLRILFAGTPEFAVPPLRQLIDRECPPVAVLTQPDRPAGRGRRILASPVKQLAIEAGIPVHQPSTLKSGQVREILEGLAADLMIVVAYGLILPAEILQVPRFGCWNIHASLLPRWRGAAPIQRAIEHGDRESGICIMQMDEGLDTGPVIHRVRTPLDERETGGSLHDRLAELGASALLECLKTLAAKGRIEAEPQLVGGASYARKLNKSEAEIDWGEPAEVLERRIRAFNPWPVAWCMIGDERTRIWKSRVVNEQHESEPGRVLVSGRNGIDIATGQKILRLLELQRPGKSRVSVADYLNARELPRSLTVGS